MGRKKSKQQPVKEPVPVEEDEVEDEEDDEDLEELDLLQVDVGDMVKVKQVLDETVLAAVTEKVEEDFRLDNIKLAVGFGACLFAMAAQFAPIPFPESRPLLGVCCCCYFALSGILQFITTFVDKDCIGITKSSPESGNPDLKTHGIRIRTKFPRFSEFYTVILEYQGREDSPYVEQRWSVGKFFDMEGMFDEVGLQQEVGKVYQRLESGKYDKKSGGSKKND